MRKIVNVFYFTINIILMIISAVFVFIEGRLVFSGDWILHQNVLIAFMQYLIKFLLAIGCFVFGLISILKRNKINTFYFSICIFAIAVALSIYVSNGFGAYFIIFSVVYVIVYWFYCYIKTFQVNK